MAYNATRPTDVALQQDNNVELLIYFQSYFFRSDYKRNVPKAEHRRRETSRRGAQAVGLSYVKLAAPYERKNINNYS